MSPRKQEPSDTFQLFEGHEYDVDWATCRSNGHAWDTIEVEVLANGVIARKLRCHRHEGERIDEVKRSTGVVLRRLYRMPKGYYVKGHGVLDRSIFRRSVIESELMRLGGAREQDHRTRKTRAA